MILVDTSVWIELLNGRLAGKTAAADLTDFASGSPLFAGSLPLVA